MKCNHKGHILDHFDSLATPLRLLGTRKDIGKRAKWGRRCFQVLWHVCQYCLPGLQNARQALLKSMFCFVFFFFLSLVAGRSKDHRDSCADKPRHTEHDNMHPFRKTSLYFCVSSHLSLMCVAPFLNLRLFYFIFFQEREIKGAHLISLSVETIKHLTFCLEVWERGGLRCCWWGEVKLMQNYLFLSYSHDPLHPPCPVLWEKRCVRIHFKHLLEN